MRLKAGDEFESHIGQRNLALEVIDDLMQVKLEIMDADKKVPAFINNALQYLKKKYVTEEQTISKLLLKRSN